jgi:hypothetical protein
VDATRAGEAAVTGIQHRWDCPVRTHGLPREMAETVVPSLLHEHREYRRCRYCHRSAMFDRRLTQKEEEQ